VGEVTAHFDGHVGVVHEVAALLLARSNNTDDAMGEFIPQAVYDSLFERRLLRVASDMTGEAYAMTTVEGDAYLRAALEGAGS